MIAPLALVQAFAAGGLALSVPLAAGVFRHRVTRGQVLAVLVIAAGLAALPIGFSTVADRLQSGRLTAALVVGAVAAVALGRVRAPAARAAAAGCSTDSPTRRSRRSRSTGTTTGRRAWRAGGRWWPRRHVRRLRLLQAALETGAAVPGISLMTAGTALVALACGLGAFGESLGAGAGVSLMHGLAIVAVLAGVPVLAAAHTAIVESADHRDERPSPRPRPLPAIGRPR